MFDQADQPTRKVRPVALERLALAILGIAVVWLGVETHQQRARIQALDARVGRLASASRGSTPGSDPSAVSVASDAREQRSSPRVVAGAARASAIAVRQSSAPALRDEERPPARPDHATPSDVVDDTQQMRVSLINALDSHDPALEERLRAAVRDQREYERDIRREQRQNRWEQTTRERLTKLAHDVGLNQAQSDALFAILVLARDRTDDAIQTGHHQGDIKGALRTASTLRSEADDDVRKLLTDAQFGGYKAMRAEELKRLDIGSVLRR
jgi:hypothetical protein